MITCKGCQYDFGPQDLILGFCRDCVIDQHSDKIGRLQAELSALRTDRDELYATLSGLCSFLGAGTPDSTTTAAEMNRRIHAGIKRREEAARDKALTPEGGGK